MSSNSASSSLAVSTYGLRVELRASNAELLHMMTARLPPRWVASPGASADRLYELEWLPGGSHQAIVGLSADRCGLGQGPLDIALDAFGADVQAFVAEMSPDRVFVHAGAVGWRGQAIILPGRSWSGKSTLVAELVRLGATYYSDEYAVFDGAGYLHPYSRPLSLRQADGTMRVNVEELGGTAGDAPLPTGLVVLSTYREDAAWRPQVVSPGQAVLEMVAHTVSIRRQPAFALAVLQRSVAGARTFRGERGDAASLAIELLHEEICA